MVRALRTVTVKEKNQLSPNLMQMILEGESLSDFPEGFEGGYVKLTFPSGVEKPIMRSYTIRSFSPESKALTLEMVSHGDAGPAARWANQAERGTEIDINGPGACQLINTEADWFLLAGDMSALPAIRVNLDKLPSDAQGDLVLEVISEADMIELDLPAGMNLHWIVNPEPEAPNSVLEDTVMSLPFREGQPSIWVAGEFSASRALRQYYRHQKQVDKNDIYLSCYWKIGDTDEGMKAAKKADPEPW